MAFETTKQIKFVASVDGADKVRASFRGISDGMTGMQRAASFASNALAGIVGTAGAGVFVGLVRGAIDAKAKLYDLSLQTGISVEKLGGLSKVALLSGTDMERVARASNNLSKALATTNEDSEGAAQGLKALGLNYKDFKALAPEEQLLAVAKAMEGFADGTGKTAAAMLLFGKNGAELLPFMKELAERGIMVSKQTTESALAAKEFSDNLILLKGAGEGWATSVANTVLPGLVALTKQLEEAKTPAEKLWQLLRNMGDNLGFGELTQQTMALKRLQFEIAQTQRHIEQLEDAKRRPRSGFNAYGEAELQKETARLATLNAQAAAMSEGLKKLADQSQGITRGGDPLRDKTGWEFPRPNVVVADLDALKRARKEAEDRAKAELKQAQDNAAARSALRQEEAKAIAEFELHESQRRNKEVAFAQEALARAHAEYDQRGLLRSQLAEITLARLQDKQAAFVAGSANFDAVQLEIQAQRELIDVLRSGERRDKFERNDSLAGADRAVKAYLEDVEAAGLATERAVGDAIHSLEDGMTQLFTKGTFDARAFVDQLISEFVRLAIIKPMLASIFETGSAGGGSLAANLIGLFAAGYTSDPGLASNGYATTAGISGGRAMGGPVSGGSAYMVGERGPEVFVPNSSGTIVPNGGAQVTYAPTINIDSRSDRAQVAQQTAQAVQAGNRQLVDMLRARGIM